MPEARSDRVLIVDRPGRRENARGIIKWNDTATRAVAIVEMPKEAATREFQAGPLSVYETVFRALDWVRRMLTDLDDKEGSTEAAMSDPPLVIKPSVGVTPQAFAAVVERIEELEKDSHAPTPIPTDDRIREIARGVVAGHLPDIKEEILKSIPPPTNDTDDGYLPVRTAADANPETGDLAADRAQALHKALPGFKGAFKPGHDWWDTDDVIALYKQGILTKVETRALLGLPWPAKAGNQ